MLSNKEINKKMLVKQTINSMNKQIQKLEEQKKVYLDAGKLAKEKDLPAQYELAMNGLRMTIAQQKRMYEMKLNFEITAQLTDMTYMTGEFLRGMDSLSKEMMKLSKNKEFFKVGKQFSDAVHATEAQAAQLEEYMKNTEKSFDSEEYRSDSDAAELDKAVVAEIADDKNSESLAFAVEVERELEALKNQIG